MAAWSNEIYLSKKIDFFCEFHKKNLRKAIWNIQISIIHWREATPDQILFWCIQNRRAAQWQKSMATGWGYGLNQIPPASQVPHHPHFHKRLVNNPGRRGMKMKVLSKLVKSNRKLERIPGTVRNNFLFQTIDRSASDLRCRKWYFDHSSRTVFSITSCFAPWVSHDSHSVERSALIALPFRAPTESESVLCSSRGALITFVVIVLIVLGSAIAVGVTLGTIGSRSSNGGSTSNTGQTTNSQNTRTSIDWAGRDQHAMICLI